MEKLWDYNYSEEDTNVLQVQEWLKRKTKEQSRRCHAIRRNDLLPLLFCASQKQYLIGVHQGMEYQEKQARAVFYKMANHVLEACNMERLNPERNKFDLLLLLCFQPEEMYSLSELIEVIAENN